MSDFVGETPLTKAASLADKAEAGEGASKASSPVRRSGHSHKRDWRKRFEITLLSGPAIVIFLAFVIFPVVMAAYSGFFNWKGYGAPTNFIGLENYAVILKDPAFIDALKQNGFIVVMSLILQGPAAVGRAPMLNRQMRGCSLIRVLIFVPYVVAEVIVATGWALTLQTTGAVNDLLIKMGFPDWTVNWLSDPSIAIWSLMLIISWKYIGFAVILFLAGLQSIPTELYEAAAIDGSSYWQIEISITRPVLRPRIGMRSLLSIVGSPQRFDLVYSIWG